MLAMFLLFRLLYHGYTVVVGDVVVGEVDALRDVEAVCDIGVFAMMLLWAKILSF